MTARVMACAIWSLSLLGLAACEPAPEPQQEADSEIASSDAALLWGWRYRCHGDEACEITAADCPWWANVIEGTEGDDVIEGTDRSDCILGHGGNDIIRGGTGHDLIFGGAGDDVIDGGKGSDRLFGGPGSDRISGGRGFDVMYGGGCHDLLQGDSGLDLALGGSGYDACERLRECEASSAAGDICASDADCGPDERCVAPVGICVPAHASQCSGPTEPPCEVTDAGDGTCDGLDGDCDGAVDEGYAETMSSCGEGLCQGFGTVTCVDGGLVDDCEPIGSEQVDDGNPCTADSCDPVLGELHEPLPVGASCSDGDACNGEEVCGFSETAVLPVTPMQTYLRFFADSAAAAPLVVDLAASGFAAGDTIELEAEGSWTPASRQAAIFDLFGVFSASDTVLDGDQEHRVPDALVTPLPQHVSVPTMFNSLPTDILEDFVIPAAGVQVAIPDGATHLVVGISDEWYGDNRLVDRPLGVIIRHLEISCLPGEPPADMCL